MYMHRESRKIDGRDDEFYLQEMIRDGTEDEQNASHDTDVYLNLEGGDILILDTGALVSANEDTSAPNNDVNKYIDAAPYS